MDRYVRYAALVGFPELARSVGLDPEALMAGVGLDIADIDVQDKWIPAVPVARLLETSAKRSGCEDFGVRLSRLRGISGLGPLSIVLREEPDLRSVLDLLSRYERAYNGILDLRLIEGDSLARVEVWLEFGEPAPVRQGLDLTTAHLTRIIRALVRADWTPLSAHFSHPAPADRTAFHEVFGPGLRFDQAWTGVVMPVRDLDLPTVGADAALRPYTRRFLQTVAVPPARTATEEVRSLMELLLPTGRCSMAHISRTLGVQPRTLHRHLAEEGQTFSGILHATRASLVERYLANDRYSLTDISTMLGFAAPSAFSTWFHHRFGTTPTEWRSRARMGAPPEVGRGD